MASGSLATHLPGWLWGKGNDGQWKPLDLNPASDADCWMAYSLIEAGRFWRNPDYTALGHAMLAQIARQEVAELPGFGTMLLPGPPRSYVHNQTWMLNPSYVPLFMFERFAVTDTSGPWRAIAHNIPRLLQQSARGGFAMDWTDYAPGKGFAPSSGPDPLQPGKSEPAPVGSYDAIRVYLWAGMTDGTAPVRKQVLDAVSEMARYLADHGYPPEKVSAQGIPWEQDGPIGFSAAVLPYLRARIGLDKAVAQQQVRMSAQLNPATGLYGRTPAYYDQNLALFATGFLEGRFRFGAHGELKVEWTRE
jgi:endoglucanase